MDAHNLDWDVLIPSIIIGYDINFVRYIIDEIYESFYRDHLYTIPYLIERLYDTTGVTTLLDIDCTIKVT